MKNNQNYLKLLKILREKYIKSFMHLDPYDTNPNQNRENQWGLYLASVGCYRSTTYSDNSIECPDSYHRAYKTHYIKIPEELAIKALTLGYLP